MADVRVLSLGVGVQSSTLLHMMLDGEIEPVDFAIFADTHREPAAVYRYLEYLKQRAEGRIPIHVVSEGDVWQEVEKALAGENWRSIPFHIEHADGKGMLNRSCTRDYKLYVIRRKVRELVAAGKTVEQVIGISLDEVERMKDSGARDITNVYPLVDMGITRHACLRWLADRGYPDPPKSASIFCPFRSNVSWGDLKRNHPEDWERACLLDEQIRSGQLKGVKGTPYLHFSRKPLRQANISRTRTSNQISFDDFGAECEGMCGV